MITFSFENEAEECRRLAADYRGDPEGPFLLRLANSFEELAAQTVRGGRLQPDCIACNSEVANP